MIVIRDRLVQAVNILFALTALCFAIGMAGSLVQAAALWALTDSSPAWPIGRGMVCLVFTLAFLVLSRLDEYQFVPATVTTTTTRRRGHRRRTRRATTR